MRSSLAAPPGYKVVDADLAQIECRIVAWICSAPILLDQFASNKDPYAEMASAIFGFKVDKNEHPIQRFIGKGAVLGLGYGMGATKFYDNVLKQGRLLKIDLGTVWTPDLAQKSVDIYRSLHYQIPAGWRALDRIIETAWMGKSAPAKFGPNGCITISYGRITGPDGFGMDYAKPRCARHSEFWFDYGRFAHKIYGGKALENIVQFLARQIIRNAAIRLADKGLRFVLQAHDELGFIVLDKLVDRAKKIIHTEMVRRPSWGPDLPLKADVTHGQSYGEAK